jgi:ApaG protein
MDNINCEIRIQVATNYVDEQSEPDEGRYVFAYTITISNEGDIPAQLISRHWVIEVFRYSSGAVLETPVGAMQGLYRMKTDNGISFDAPIAPFTLAVPGVLN